MKTTIALGLLAFTSTLALAQEAESVTLLNNVEQIEGEGVTFDKAVVEVAKVSDTLVTTSTTYYNPRVWVGSYLDNFFVNYLNGNQFCRERGHREEADGSTIKCGEDESSYAEYNWYAKSWENKSTGSKNQCYPLYATIKCQ
ncbi:hypothetical protein HG263_16855 [Pseudoalteromonas sp. JBTF-M23]|uniref:Uncharacterized protein n=1 Tax=Pseudoalteromonas caenipelagi TaxID=2726988 RepID=A0A849VKG8_9GAMM|nr:hypothetical protein [Pseudoalteromonas caenipelagi]NOU52201.1 hypothetical protein [Pseudoalteromonas caenipelagi]